MRTAECEGFLLELGPNTVRPTPALLALAAEIGLADEIVFAAPKLPRFVEIEGRLRRVPFGALSAGAMLRAAAEPFLPGRPPRDDESAFDFIARRFGRGVAASLLEPFASGIWAGDARRLTAAAAFPSIVALARRGRGSVVRGAIARGRGPRAAAPRGLLSFRSGLGALPRALAASLGPRFRPNEAARAIARDAAQWRIETAAGDFAAASVVLAGSAPDSARLIERVSPDAARALDAVPASSLAVVHAAWPEESFARPRRGFGHLVADPSGGGVLGAVWSSAIYAGRAPAGQALLTWFVGGRRFPEAARAGDAEIASAIEADARSALGATSAPRVLRIGRSVAAIPQYEAGHFRRLEVLARAEGANPGLRFLGNYRGGVAVGSVIDNAAIMP